MGIEEILALIAPIWYANRMMRKLTPDWEQISNILIYKLDEIADSIEWKIENDEEPIIAVNDAVDELKLFIGAIEDDPGQFSMRDVS
jgi:hypothetical protein